MEILLAIGVALVLNFAVNLLCNNVLFPGQSTEPVPPGEVIDEGMLTDTDRKMAERSREIIEDNLGEQPVDALLTLNAEDRVKAVGEVLEELSRLYGVDIKGAEFTNALPNNVAGAYYHQEHMIRINVNALLSNDRAVLLDVLDTVVHELRHAVQWSMIEGKNSVWEASEAHRQALARNFAHYVRYDRDVRGYQMQLVERDAVTFAATVMRGVNG